MIELLLKELLGAVLLVLIQHFIRWFRGCSVCSLRGAHKLSCPENPGAPVKLYL